MSNAFIQKVARDKVTSEANKRNGYIFSAPNKDEHGRKLSKKDKIRWEIAQYSDPRWAIPERDLRILMEVKRRAKQLDTGHSIGPLKFGQASILGLVPVIGDFADVILAYLRVYRKAKTVTKGDDMLAFKSGMKVRIVALGSIGSIPFIGDFADTLLRFNIQNAAALERLLLKRSGYFEVKAKEKAMKKSSRHRKASTSPSNDSLPPPRYESSRHDHHVLPQQVTGVTTRHVEPGSNCKSGWLAKLSRPKTNGETQMQAEAPPARPPRPDNGRNLGFMQREGHF